MNPLRPPSISGVRFVSSRDARTCIVHQFAFVARREYDAVRELLRQLQPGQEICVEGCGPVEAYLEVRRTAVELQVRTSHHGSTGVWAAATFQEAQDLLAAVAPHVNGSRPQFTGIYTIYPDDGTA